VKIILDKTLQSLGNGSAYQRGHKTAATKKSGKAHVRLDSLVAAVPNSVTVDTRQGVAVEYITRMAG